MKKTFYKEGQRTTYHNKKLEISKSRAFIYLKKYIYNEGQRPTYHNKKLEIS